MVYIDHVATIFITTEWPVDQLVPFTPFVHVAHCIDHKFHVHVPFTHEYCKDNIHPLTVAHIIDVPFTPFVHGFP
ncbi:MAG: hypothetical protein WCL02_09675 [bacterium]